MPMQLLYNLRNPGHVYRCYYTDACQRYDASGVRQTSVSVDSYSNCAVSANPLYSDPDLILQNRPGRPFIVEPSGSPAEFTVTVDLGRTIHVNQTEAYFLGPGLDPTTLSVSYSLGGSTWSTPEAATRHNPDRWRHFGSAVAARYVRLRCVGFRGASIRFAGVRVLPDAVNGSALFDNEGFDAFHTAYVSAADTGDASWGTIEWGRSILTDWLAQNMRWGGYLAGDSGKSAESTYRLAWAVPQYVKAFKFAFRDFGTGPDQWQLGARIDGDVPGVGWTELWATDDPVSSDTVVVLDEAVEVSQLRLVNQHGTYPAGSKTYSTFGSAGTDISSGSGTGTGSLHRLHIVTVTDDPAPQPHFSVFVPTAGRLSVALRDASNDQIVRHLWWAEPVTAGTKRFWWDNADFRGSFIGAKTVYPCALLTQAEVENGPGIAHHLQIQGTQSAYSSANAAMGSTRVIHYTADGNFMVQGAAFEEGDVHLAYVNLSTYARTWSQTSTYSETYSITSDATYVYLVRAAGASGHLLIRVNRSNGDSPSTLATVSASTATPAKIIGLSAEPSGHLFYLDIDSTSVVIRQKSGTVVDASALTGLTSPTGFCLDPRGGAFWVAYGSVIRKFEYNPSTYEVNETAAAEIAFTGAENLHVIERDTDEYALVFSKPGATYAVYEYDVTTDTPAAGGALHQTVEERRHDADWDWSKPVYIGAFGIGPNGDYGWSDIASRSVAFFDSAGTLAHKGYREFQGAPKWHEDGIVSGKAKVTTAVAEYEVALDGTTLEGGLGDGSWRPLRTLADDRFRHWNRVQSPTGYFTAQTPWGEITYLVHVGRERGASIFQIMPDGSRRRCAKVGWGTNNKWTGINGDGSVSSANSYTWTDTDGDGVIDVAPGSEASPQGEVSYFGSLESDGRPIFDRSGRMLVSNVSIGDWDGHAVMLAPRFELVEGSDPPAVNVSYRFDRAYLALPKPTVLVSSDTSYAYQDVCSDDKGGMVLLERGIENEGYATRALRDGTLLRHSFLITRQSNNSYNSWIAGDQGGRTIGVVGACGMRVDSQYARLQHPNATDFDFERTDAWSFECWLVCRHGASSAVLFGKYDGTAARGIAVSVTATPGLAIILRNTASTNELWVEVAPGTLTANALHHIVVTYDGSSAPGGIKVYVDGASKSLTTSANTLSATIQNTAPLTLMRRVGSVDGVQGVLGQTRLWNRALSGSEAAELYESGVVYRYADLSSGLQSGLVADWPLDDEIQVAERANLLMPDKPLIDSGLVPAAMPCRELSQVGLEPNDLLIESVSQVEGLSSNGDTGLGSAFFVRDTAKGLPVLAFSSGSDTQGLNHPWVAGWQDTAHGHHLLRVDDATAYLIAMHVRSSAYAIFKLTNLDLTSYAEGTEIVWSDRYTVDSGGGQVLEVEWSNGGRALLGAAIMARGMRMF